MTTFNLGTLFENAFGYQLPDSQFSIKEADAKTAFSSLGQPYYETDLYGREFFMPVRLDGYLLPFPVISLSTKHTIVETALVERRGTVKELISADDWNISIKGLIVRPDNSFPEAELRELEELRAKSLKGALEMRSALTDIFLQGEDKVVMKSFTPSMITGVEHAVAYTMEFVSDLVYDLELS